MRIFSAGNFKTGDKVISWDKRITGVAGEIGADTFLLKDVAGEEIPVGAIPYYPITAFEKAQ